MSKNIFITATGTDVGKTYVSALIVKEMRKAGYNCGYFKPVLSGIEEQNGKLTVSDANYVVDTAKIPCEADNCVGYWWKEAVSPHLAAKRAGKDIEIEKIKQKFEELSKDYDYLLIEGAGGITCPLRLENGEKYLLKDLIKELETSIILNNFNPDSFMHQDNLKQVEYLTGIKVVATVERGQKDIKLLEELWTGRKKI